MFPITQARQIRNIELHGYQISTTRAACNSDDAITLRRLLYRCMYIFLRAAKTWLCKIARPAFQNCASLFQQIVLYRSITHALSNISVCVGTWHIPIVFCLANRTGYIGVHQEISHHVPLLINYNELSVLYLLQQCNDIHYPMYSQCFTSA